MQSCNSVDLVEQTSRAKCIPGETFGCAKRGMMHVQNCRGTFRCDKGPIISCGYPPGAREYWCPCNGKGNGSMSLSKFLHYENRAGHVSGSCPCRSIGRFWSNNAGGSALNLSMAVAGVDNMRIWPELHSERFWHMDNSLIRQRSVPFNADPEPRLLVSTAGVRPHPPTQMRRLARRRQCRLSLFFPRPRRPRAAGGQQGRSCSRWALS